MTRMQYPFSSPVGILYLVASERGLQSIDRLKQDVPLCQDVKKHSILKQAVKELQEYFAGKRQDFSIPLDLQGTDFQKRVWQALQRIPYGQTISYKQLAANIKNPKAVRAVGGANGKNPVCIIVPCHRVIAADGGIGGYSGGLSMKKKLLTIEGASLA